MTYQNLLGFAVLRRLRTTVGRQLELRNYGGCAILKTNVVRQKEGGSRSFVFRLLPFVVRLRSDSEAQNITTLQQHYKRTTDFGYAKTTRQLVGRQPLVVSLSCRLVVCEATAKPAQGSQLFSTFYTNFSPLSLVFRQKNITTLLHYKRSEGVCVTNSKENIFR